MESFTDDVAIVTGAGSGIGRQTAIAFADRGARLVIADLDVEGGEETVEEIESDGGEALFIETDVTDAEEAEKMVEAAVSEFGRLDYAFNNAGISGESAPLADYDPDQWEAVISVNLTGVFNCLRAELAQMQEQEDGGVVVNNSSVLGKVGFETGGAYSSAKHGVLGMTKTAALENGETDVRVNAVCPGFISTPMIDDSDDLAEGSEARTEIEQRHAMNRLGTPAEVANAVCWLCSENASFVTGEALGVEGGYLSR
ncbi:SDR family NAD(P)-dependent oxidoreductase [Halococcus thailandensis]|uniref:Short-chain dehydrogenase/reductase SDR n=1 Tax=Halococcus thailandensis JCM 13552 TaxID=1227457 RepID=M0ND55_9EURY|nr:glucose 1-dehydrogenase [Halococcus thailandensis]EMA54994.1 short-chain dehydrogenase/reductase SDR [Halococcus thailandensis JCM 13552]